MFAQESTLPFQTPDFAAITDADYQPAIEQGDGDPARRDRGDRRQSGRADVREHDRRARAHRAGCSTASNRVRPGHRRPTPTTRSTRSTPRWRRSSSAHNDAIYLDSRALRAGQGGLRQPRGDEHDARGRLAARDTYDDFVHAGAQLTPAQKDELKAINTRTVRARPPQFSQKLTAAQQRQGALVVADRARARRPEREPDRRRGRAPPRPRACRASTCWRCRTPRSSRCSPADQPRDARGAVRASVHRADRGDANDTRALIAEIVRAARAQGGAVRRARLGALRDVRPHGDGPGDRARLHASRSCPRARRDAAARGGELLDARSRADGDFEVEPWDWELLRREGAQGALRPRRGRRSSRTSRSTRVLEDGVFFAAEPALRHELPASAPTCRSITRTCASTRCSTTTARELGAVLLRLLPARQQARRRVDGQLRRAEQAAGRQAGRLQRRSTSPKPAAGPAGADELRRRRPRCSTSSATRSTACSPNQRTRALGHQRARATSSSSRASSTRTGRREPEVLGELRPALPDRRADPAELVDKIERRRASSTRATSSARCSTAALLDMEWHALTPRQQRHRPRTSTRSRRRRCSGSGSTSTLVPPRYRTQLLPPHLRRRGYSAGYYSLHVDRDARPRRRAWFRENGGLTRANGDHYRATVLGQGHARTTSRCSATSPAASRGSSRCCAPRVADFRMRHPTGSAAAASAAGRRDSGRLRRTRPPATCGRVPPSEPKFSTNRGAYR